MPSRNNRDNIRNSKFTSNDVQELKLIQMNVEQTKKDVADISTYAQKEINTITNAIDKALSKLEALNKKSKGSYENMSQQEKKLFQEQMRYVRTLDNEREKSLKKAQSEEDKALKNQRQKYLAYHDSRIASENSRSAYQSQAIGQALRGNVSGAMNSMVNMRQADQRARIASGEDNLRRLFENGTIGQEKFESGMENFSKMTGKLDKSAGKFQAAGTIFQTAVNGITKMVSIWLTRFDNGINKIADTYENIYQKQAVLSGVNEKQYQQAQKDMRDNIKQMGLEDNLAVTEVMNETSDYISRGITDFGKASQMGQLSAINKVLAPYLDMQSDAITSLELAMPGISKSMSGIGKYISDTVGQNRFTQKNLQNLIELTEPVSLAAKKDLLGEEGLAMIEDLVAGGMDMQTATQMATDIAGAVADPLKALQGDNVALASAIAAGERDFTGIAKYAMGTQRSIMRGTDGDLGSAAALQSAGLWGVYNYDFDKEFSRVINNQDSGKYKETNPTKTYEDLVTKFSNGDLTTAKQEKDILAENLAVDVAIYKERWPDLYEVIREVGGAIVKALALWIGSKLLGGLLGKGGGTGLLGKLAGGGGKHAAAGSTFSSVVAPVAQIAGGGLAIYDGVKDIGTDFNNARKGDQYSGYATGRTAMDVVEIGAGATAVGAGALTALGVATGPVGWIALGVAGLAAAGKAAFDYAEYCEKSTDATENLTKQTEAQLKQMQDNHYKEMSSLNEFNERIQQTNDVETAKKLMIEAGIATESELQGEQYNSIKALKELTQTYVDSKKAMNEDTEKYFQDLKNMTNDEQKGFIKDYLKKYGEDMDYKNLGEKDKAAINEYGKQMQLYIQDLVDSGEIDNESNKHAKYMWEHGILDKNYNDDLTEDDYRILFREGTNADRRQVGNNMLSLDKYYNGLMASGTNSKDVLGWKYNYNAINGNEEEISGKVSSLIAASKSNDKSSVESYVSALKLLGVNSLDNLPDNMKTDVQNALNAVGINSYAIGSNYIPENGLAYLHEGEAVLTKAAANILRSNTNFNASSVYGVSDAIQNGSTLNREGFNLVVNAIKDQTAQLIAKMDQILAAVTQNKYTPKYNSKLINLEGGVN